MVALGRFDSAAELIESATSREAQEIRTEVAWHGKA